MLGSSQRREVRRGTAPAEDTAPPSPRRAAWCSSSPVKRITDRSAGSCRAQEISNGILSAVSRGSNPLRVRTGQKETREELREEGSGAQHLLE